MLRRLIALFVLGLLLIGSGYLFSRLISQSAGRLNIEATSEESPTSSEINLISTKTRQTFQVELAVTTEQQAQGLSNRQNLSKNSGMLFVFQPATQPKFWMKDMKFPIDIVWIKDGQIIGIERNLPVPKTDLPADDLPTYKPSGPVDYVLEVTAGEASEFKPGDRFELIQAI